MISLERLPWGAVPWEALDRFQDRNVFQTLPWLKFVATTQKAEPLVAAVKLDGDVVGYFTGLLVRKFGLTILGSPFRGWTTVCMGFNLPPGFPRHDALEALCAFGFKQLGCHHIELVDRHLDKLACTTMGYEARTLQTYEVDLTAPEDEMWMRVTGACRRAIRKAAKEGVVVEESSDSGFADEYHAQLNDVFKKQSLVPTYDAARVRELIRCLHPSGNLLLLVAKNASGASMASGIFPAFNDSMYYWGGASWRQHQILRPNEPLMWHAMKYWKARGIRRFDMLGAGREADGYKKRYGAVLVPSGTHMISSKYAVLTPLRNIARGILRAAPGRLGTIGVSRTRTVNDLLGAVSAYGGRFALWTLGVAALFTLSALIASWILSRQGWLDIARGGPRWFRALAIFVVCATGLAIGIVAGVRVGAIKTGIHLLEANGPELIALGLEKVSAPLGLPDVREEIGLESVRAVLDGIKDVRLIDSAGMKSAIINGAFDIVRRPFVTRAERFLANVAPGDKVSLADLVDATWSQLERRIQRIGDALILSALLDGYVWLATLIFAVLLCAWLVRAARASGV